MDYIAPFAALLHIVLLYFLLFPFVMIALSFLRKAPAAPRAGKEVDFACIITAYKQADITVPLVESLRKQTHARLHIYLVADQCDANHLQWDDERVTVLQPGTPLNSKVKSIRHALRNFVREHDYIVIFDPDNLAPPQFLQELNRYAATGMPAVQGERKPKNLDSLYACLDAAGESYYNRSARYVPFRLGSSAGISGSGMAIQTARFRQYLESPELNLDGEALIIAEDKILQLFIVGQGGRIAYHRDAFLYDEKVSSGNQVERQRTRWIKSYFQHLPTDLRILWAGIRHFDLNRLLFGLFVAYLPMFLTVSGSVLLIFADLLHFLFTGHSDALNGALLLMAGLAVFVGNFLWVMYLEKVPQAVWRSLWGIPFFILRQFRAFFSMRKAKKDFMVTTHNRVVQLEELEK